MEKRKGKASCVTLMAGVCALILTVTAAGLFAQSQDIQTATREAQSDTLNQGRSLELNTEASAITPEAEKTSPSSESAAAAGTRSDLSVQSQAQPIAAPAKEAEAAQGKEAAEASGRSDMSVQSQANPLPTPEEAAKKNSDQSVSTAAHPDSAPEPAPAKDCNDCKINTVSKPLPPAEPPPPGAAAPIKPSSLESASSATKPVPSTSSGEQTNVLVNDLIADRMYLRTGPNSGSEVSSPVAGQQYYVHFDWRNTFTTTQNVPIQVLLNGTILCSGTVAAGGNTSVIIWCTAAITWPSGNNTISGRLDPNNIITETIENNNNIDRTYSGGGGAGDLIADRVYLRTGPNSGSEVTSPVAGQQYYVHFDWRNTFTTTQSVPIEILLNGTVLCGGNVSAGANTSIINWCTAAVTWPSGNNTISGRLDPNNNITETNENNNTASRTFTGGGAGDLIADRMYLRTGPNSGTEVTSPVAGQQYYVHFDWRNTFTTSQNVPIEILLNGTVLCAGNVSAGPNTSIINWCTAAITWPTGNNTISGRLDPNNAITETNENNNTASRTFTGGGAGDLIADRVYLRTGPNSGSEVTTPVAGQQYYVHFDWRNTFTTTQNVPIEILLNGTILCSGNVSAGANTSIINWCTAAVTWPSGNNTISGRLDPNNAITETNENNNSASRTFTGGGAGDLIADRMYLRTGPNSGSEVATPVAGQQYYVHFDWRNTFTTTQNVPIEILLNGTVLCAGNVSAGPNTSIINWCTAAVTWPSGSNTISGRLDPNNAIAETNENNNTASRTFTGGGAGDLIADRMYLRTGPNSGSEVTTPVAGQQYYVHFDWRNTFTTTQNVPIEILLNGTILCSGNVSAGANTSIINWCTAAVTWPSGNNTISGRLDPNNVITEANENNNTASRTFAGGGDGDLIADRMYLRTGPNSGSEVTNPTTGQQYYVHFDWRSTFTTSQNVPIQILLNGTVLCSGTVTAGPNTSIINWCTAAVTWPSGTNTISGRLDPGNVITESNEGNNNVDRTFGGGPQDIDVSPTSITINETAAEYSGEAGHIFEIRLKNRRFVPTAGEYLVLASGSGQQRHHVILQFTSMPAVEQLRQKDVQTLNYIPNNAILASVPTGFDPTGLANLRWMGKLMPADKLSAFAARQMREQPGQSQTFTIEAFRDVANLPEIITKAGGTARQHPSHPAYIQLVTAKAEVFSQLAADERIAWIGAVSTALINFEEVFYCPGPLTVYGPMAEYVTVGDGWDGPGLGAAALTYYFTNGTPDIAGSAEHDEIRRALAVWANYAQLTFTETATPNANRSFDVLWAAGAHGDGSPFDGPGGVLAHAYYPVNPNSETIAGDIHFDEDENWSLTGNIHQFTVGLHEAGHSLGLGHSADPNAVMFASYHGAVTDLHSDDIAGIRALYAERGAGANQFTIRNVGGANLSVTSITDDSNWLTTTGYPSTPFNISPGGSQNVTVNVDWNLVGNTTRTGIVTIASNDPDEPTVTVRVTAIPRNGGGDCTLCGDVNEDNVVNSTDALIFLSYDIGLTIPQQYLDAINRGCGDVNLDNATNSTDALIILTCDAGLPQCPSNVGRPGGCR